MTSNGAKLTAILLVALAVAAGFGYWLFAPEILNEATATSSTTQSSSEQKSGLVVSFISDLVHDVFPAMHNCTSVIENTNSMAVDSMEITQSLPDGFNITDAYLAGPDGSRKPAISAQGLTYSLATPLGPSQRIFVVVLLQETAMAASGELTINVTGIVNGKQIRSEVAGQVIVKPPQTTCRDDATISFGDFLLDNNVWGGRHEQHLQCMIYGPGSFGWNLTRLSPSPIHYSGWFEVAPNYPEVIYGKDALSRPFAFSQPSSTTRNLPVAIDSLRSLEVSMRVTIKPYEKYNFAFDIWITNRKESNPSDVTDEIMIWFVWTPGLEREHILDTLSDGYNTYQHRTIPNMTHTDTNPDMRWIDHEFTIARQGIPPRINLLAFVDHLRKEKYDLRYISSIELGNEAYSGIGATNFTEFRIDMKTTQEPSTSTTSDHTDWSTWFVVADRRHSEGITHMTTCWP